MSCESMNIKSHIWQAQSLQEDVPFQKVVALVFEILKVLLQQETTTFENINYRIYFRVKLLFVGLFPRVPDGY